LARIAPTLLYLALAPGMGARQAVREIAAEHELMGSGVNLSQAS
jgi:hypothetical protein